MIIEIKDLPKDRNIRSVEFHITFEDGDVKSIEQFTHKPTNPKPPIPEFPKMDTTGVTETPSISDISSSPDTFKVHEAPTNLDTRPPKNDGFVDESF